MRKALLAPLPLKLIVYPNQTVLTVELKSEDVPAWCAALCLLRESLSNILEVHGEDMRTRLEIRFNCERKTRVRSKASFAPELTIMDITTNDLDYLLHFLLKFYRDGMAEVDHLDLEAETGGKCHEGCITFKFQESAPPVSAEDAKRRLGLS